MLPLWHTLCGHPLSRQNTFNFHKDFIRVIYDPDQTVADQYVDILEKWLEETYRIS